MAPYNQVSRLVHQNLRGCMSTVYALGERCSPALRSPRVFDRRPTRKGKEMALIVVIRDVPTTLHFRSEHSCNSPQSRKLPMKIGTWLRLWKGCTSAQSGHRLRRSPLLCHPSTDGKGSQYPSKGMTKSGTPRQGRRVTERANLSGSAAKNITDRGE